MVQIYTVLKLFSSMFEPNTQLMLTSRLPDRRVVYFYREITSEKEIGMLPLLQNVNNHWGSEYELRLV